MNKTVLIILNSKKMGRANFFPFYESHARYIDDINSMISLKTVLMSTEK